MIKVSTFAVSSSHELTPLRSQTFDMEVKVKVTGIGAAPGSDLNTVQITYHELSGKDKHVGKVLKANLQGSVETFAFMSRAERQLTAVQQGNPAGTT